MPYGSTKEIPDYVTGSAKRKRQWMHVWNSAYDSAIKDGKSKDAAEASAFAQANSVAGPNKSGGRAVGGILDAPNRVYSAFSDHIAKNR